MGIKDIIQKFRHKNEIYEELDAQNKAVKKIRERELNADERELESYNREKHLQYVRARLSIERKKKENDWWHKDVITQKNLFAKQGCSILKQEKLF